MRPRALARGSLVALLLFATGCGLDQFEQTLVDEVTIPQTAMTQGPFSPGFDRGALSDVDFSSLREFQNNDVEPGDVDAIYVKSARLDLATGANNPAFDQLDNFMVAAELFVEAPGLPRQVVARRDMMPETASVDLDITPGDMLPGVNLKPYATAPSMSFGADLTLKENRGISAKLTTTVVLFVDIDLF